jgi:antitoxin ParD1/3/4
MVIKSSVSLRADQHAFARALDARGRFPSMSAVVQHGLDLLLQRANGPFISAEDLRSALAEQRP